MQVACQQGSWQLACKKFAQAGNVSQAMRALINSGDTQQIVTFVGGCGQGHVQRRHWGPRYQATAELCCAMQKGLQRLRGYLHASHACHQGAPLCAPRIPAMNPCPNALRVGAAGASRQRECYLLAAAHLRAQGWQSDPELMMQLVSGQGQWSVNGCMGGRYRGKLPRATAPTAGSTPPLSPDVWFHRRVGSTPTIPAPHQESCTPSAQHQASSTFPLCLPLSQPPLPSLLEVWHGRLASTPRQGHMMSWQSFLRSAPPWRWHSSVTMTRRCRWAPTGGEGRGGLWCTANTERSISQHPLQQAGSEWLPARAAPQSKAGRAGQLNAAPLCW